MKNVRRAKAKRKSRDEVIISTERLLFPPVRYDDPAYLTPFEFAVMVGAMRLAWLVFLDNAFQQAMKAGAQAIKTEASNDGEFESFKAKHYFEHYTSNREDFEGSKAPPKG